MNFKLLVTVISGVLVAVLVVIDLNSTQNSAADKWASFGLGALSVLFISGVISLIRNGKKKAV